MASEAKKAALAKLATKAGVMVLKQWAATLLNPRKAAVCSWRERSTQAIALYCALCCAHVLYCFLLCSLLSIHCSLPMLAADAALWSLPQHSCWLQARAICQQAILRLCGCAGAHPCRTRINIWCAHVQLVRCKRTSVGMLGLAMIAQANAARRSLGFERCG